MGHLQQGGRRRFVWLGLLAWLLVGLPIIASHLRPFDWRVGGWMISFALFGLAFRISESEQLRERRRARVALLSFEVAAAVAMVLLMCDGFEGLLLCLVAFQLGDLMTARSGVVWVVGQSLFSSAAMAFHWTPGAALMIGSPYFGFQLLAFFSAHLLDRVADAVAESARLEERMRIARDLHDVAGHRLTALSLNLQLLQRKAPAELREGVDISYALAQQLLSDVRGTVQTLRTDFSNEPKQSLDALAREIPRPRVHVHYPDDLSVDDPQSAQALLRCIQEIVTNAARHADAENLWIEVSDGNDRLSIRARDDGGGAASLREGNGLSGMRERLLSLGGELSIESRAGEGTTVAAQFPHRRSRA